MIKKLLGIRKLEELMERFHSKTEDHWGHTQHLYRISHENRQEIENLKQELDHKTGQLLTLMDRLIEKMERAEDKDIREVVPAQPKAQELQEEELQDTDITLLQIMHQNAALDSKNAMTTSDIYDNLTFSITKRGLRKKLMSLVKEGVMMTFKRANERYWHISTGKLSAVKHVISAKNKEEQGKD